MEAGEHNQGHDARSDKALNELTLHSCNSKENYHVNGKVRR